MSYFSIFRSTNLPASAGSYSVRDGAQGMMSGDDARRRDRRRIGDAWSGKGEASRDAVVVRSGGKLTMGPWQGVLTA